LVFAKGLPAAAGLPSVADGRFSPIPFSFMIAAATLFHFLPEFRSSTSCPVRHPDPIPSSRRLDHFQRLQSNWHSFQRQIVVISPSLLQTRSQCFQSHPASFFSLSRCQSFVLNTFQPLFTKTGG
jgi:hypothetical protein